MGKCTDCDEWIMCEGDGCCIDCSRNRVDNFPAMKEAHKVEQRMRKELEVKVAELQNVIESDESNKELRNQFRNLQFRFNDEQDEVNRLNGVIFELKKKMERAISEIK